MPPPSPPSTALVATANKSRPPVDPEATTTGKAAPASGAAVACVVPLMTLHRKADGQPIVPLLHTLTGDAAHVRASGANAGYPNDGSCFASLALGAAGSTGAGVVPPASVRAPNTPHCSQPEADLADLLEALAVDNRDFQTRVKLRPPSRAFGSFEIAVAIYAQKGIHQHEGVSLVDAVFRETQYATCKRPWSNRTNSEKANTHLRDQQMRWARVLEAVPAPHHGPQFDERIRQACGADADLRLWLLLEFDLVYLYHCIPTKRVSWSKPDGFASS